nr:hypothetical protein [Tanacetum cinerariifolium]
MVQKVKASDTSSGEKECSRIVLDKRNDQGLENQSNTSGDESSRSRNECNDKSTSGVECIINTSIVEKVDSNVIPDSPDMCDNEIQTGQNAVECDDERTALANLIANLKLDIDENKKIQNQLKKANASLTQDWKECKSTLAETSRTLGEYNSIHDSCLIALQNKQTELEKYMDFNDRTVDYDKLERKSNETLGLLAQKEIDIKESLKLKAYEISVVKEKHDELVKQNLLTKSDYEGLVKEKTKVITDLKLKEEKVIDKMISMEKQLKLLNEIVYKWNQSIQTIHMLAPKGPTFNASQKYHEQLARANEVRKKMWRKSFVKFKPNIFKNTGFLPVLKSISKSRQAYNVITNNINHFREPVDQAWEKHSHNHFHAPTTLNMELLIKTYLMPLAIKTQNDSFTFVHELKQEMHADLKYVESLKNEIDELEFDKAEFSNMYDILLQECVSNDVMYLKAQLQDKNIAISELKKLVEKKKGKGVDTNFEKHSILGKPPLQPIKNQPVKTTPPRSGLTWKPTGRIFTQAGLKWIFIRKCVKTRHNTNDSASPLGKKTHNPNTTNCANSSSLSADPSSETKLQGRFLTSFQDDAKYEHVGQDTRLQDGKDDKDKQGKDLKISKLKSKSKRKKAQDQRSHSMKEQAYNKDKDQNLMSKQSQEIQDHVMTVNMEARNLSETKLRRRLLASKYRVKQGSSFQGLRPRFGRDC